MSEANNFSQQRFVDMWVMPGVHPTNNLFLQRLKSADTAQFTRNMQVVGTASRRDEKSGGWEKTHFLGIRTDIWQPTAQEIQETLDKVREKRQESLRREIRRSGRLTDKQGLQLQSQLEDDEIMNMTPGDLEQRRLVMKLFKSNGDRTAWCGTLEQVTTSEIQNSLGSRRALISMAVMLPRTEVVTIIQEYHRTLRMPPVFSFGYYDEQRMHYVVLTKRWISFGSDFDIQIDHQDAGRINGHMFSFGTDSTVDLKGHPLVDDVRFGDLMTLFAASMGYHKAMRQSIRRRVEAVRMGRSFQHIVEDEEIRLRHNGRSAA